MSTGGNPARLRRVVSASEGGPPARTGRRYRAVPTDWPFAVRAGVESVLAGWLLVVVPTLAVYVSTSSMDAAAALSVGAAVRAGTALWALGLGGTWGSAASPDGVLGLPLLGLTVLQALITRWSVRRSRLAGLLSGLWTVLAAVVTAALVVVAAGPPGSRLWTAVLGLGGLTAFIAVGRLQRSGRGRRDVDRWWARRPCWTDPALALVRSTFLALVVLVAAVTVVAVVEGAGRVGRLHDALSAGGILASLGLIALQACWAPTMLVWALAWLAGPGFAVGAGTLFSPDSVVTGPVPAMPLLGLLPTAPLGTVGLYLPLVITAGTMVASWPRRRRLAVLGLGEAVIAALVATAVVTLGCLALALAASGPVGPGRMTQVGPHWGHLCLFIALEIGVGLVAVAVISHPGTRRLAVRGTRASAGVARGLHEDAGDAGAGAKARGDTDRWETTDRERNGRGEPTERNGQQRENVGHRVPRRGTEAGTAPLARDSGVEPAPVTEEVSAPESIPAGSAAGRGLFVGWRERASREASRERAEDEASDAPGACDAPDRED